MLDKARLQATAPLMLVKTACLLLMVLVGGSGCGKVGEKAVVAPEVRVTLPQQRTVPVYLELVGEARGKQDVDIRARVEGYLESVAFTEGSYVTKGTPLYQIDPRQLQANLLTAQARLTKTENDLKRLRPLAARNNVSQQDLDNAESALEAAQGQFELAKLNLGYATITSPIDGVVGTTLVKAGNLVGRSESTLLTTVSQVDPIVFQVGLSEAEYLRIARRRLQAPEGQRGKLPIDLLLADGSHYPHSGSYQTVERAIDATTGTLAVQFDFPNPDRLLRPGQYGRVRFAVEQLENALLVPQRAVQEIQGFYQLAIVDKENRVSLRAVNVGPRIDNLWVISEGLQPGEQVVAEGLQRVRDGMAVTPKPFVDPAAPQP